MPKPKQSKQKVGRKPTAKKPQPKPKTKPQKKPTPAAYSGRSGSYFTGAATTSVKGSDFLSVFTTTATAPTAALVLTQIQINPQTLFNLGVNTRLARYSTLFEKFRFKRITLKYTPSVGSNTPGSLFMACDNDVEDNLSNTFANNLLAKVMAYKANRIHAVYEPASLTIAGSQFFSDWLYCDPSRDSDRWAFAGEIYIGTLGALSASTTYGFHEVEFEVEFMSPALEDPGVGGGVFGYKFTTTEQSHLYRFGQTWIPGQNGVGTGANVPVTIQNVNPLGATTSYVTFGTPGVYAVIWSHTGSSLTATTFTFTGTAKSFSNGSNDWIDTTVSRESGQKIIEIRTPGDGFYTNNTFGPTINALNLSIALTPNGVTALPAPLSLAEKRRAATLKRLLDSFQDMSVNSGAATPEQHAPSPDVVEDVDLTTTTTGTIGTPGNPPMVVDTTSTTDGTIVGPDPAFLRKLYEHQFGLNLSPAPAR